MLEEPSNFVTCYCSTNNNCWNMHSENLEDIYSNTVLLDMIQNDEQCQYEWCDISENKKNFEKLNNLESADVHYDTGEKLHMSTLNKTSRTVPNILKNSTRSHRISEIDTTKTNCYCKDLINTEEYAEISFDSDTALEHTLSKNTSVKKETICKNISRRRKQKFNFVDIWHELPDWGICSILDDEEELLEQKKKLKSCIRKHNKKQKISALRNEQEDDLTSSISDNITDSTFECQVPSFLPEIESKDFQDSIDFSSNEIFSKFNYEFYSNSNSDYFTQCMSNFDELSTFFNTIEDNDIYEKKHDINHNEIDTYETLYWSLSEDKQNEKNISVRKSSMSSEYSSEDLPLFNDKKSKCSSNSCCDYCYEDCVSNWITTNGVSISIKDKLLTEVHHEVLQDDLNNSNLHTMECDVNLIDGVSREYNNKNICSSVDNFENSSQYTDDIDSILTEFINYLNEENSDTEIFEQTMYNQEQEEHNLHSGFNSETDSASEKETQDPCDTNTSQAPDNNKRSTVKKIFQCLICSLTFTNPRTMAMHRAGAHGGAYAILCESCGRLFNRKYHFNRHFVYCSRLKEPFKCDMCMKKYRHKSSLVHHLKVVHQIPCTRNYATKFTCTVCNKVYSKFGSFENHIKNHKNDW